MRDVIHCFLGALLAHELGKVIKCEPWIKFPIRWDDWTLPSSNRRSVKRVAKLLLWGFVWWQGKLDDEE